MPILKNSYPFKLPENCLYCKEAFRKEDIDLLDETTGNSVFHLTCPKCKTSFVFQLLLGNEGVLSVGTLTDAGKDDLDKLKGGKIISADDVISAYLGAKTINREK